MSDKKSIVSPVGSPVDPNRLSSSSAHVSFQNVTFPGERPSTPEDDIRRTTIQIQRPILADQRLQEPMARTKSQKQRKSEVRKMRIVEWIRTPNHWKRIFIKKLTLLFPFVNMIKEYNLPHLPSDILSGLSVGMLIIPQAIAYAALAGLKSQNGFYSAFFGMLIYFFLGSSRHLNMSSQGVISLLVGESVRECVKGFQAPLNSTNGTSIMEDTFVDQDIDPVLLYQESVSCAVTLTLLTGVFQFVMGILHLGFVTIFLSDALVSAVTCGGALHIVNSQIPKILGVKPLPSTPRFYGGLFTSLWSVLQVIRNVNGYAIVITLVCMGILLFGRWLNPRIVKSTRVPIPFDIIVLLLALIASYAWDFESNLNVEIIGDIQPGFTSPQLPDSGKMSQLALNAFVLAILTYVTNISTAKMFSLKHGYEIDSNQEFMAYGIVNFIVSLFTGFLCGGSMACTSMHDVLGGKTQVFSLLASLVTLIGILWLGPFFRTAPASSLSAIILVNLIGIIMQLSTVFKLWKVNKYDCITWIVTFLAVMGTRVDIGLLVGVIFSLGTVIYRTQSSSAMILGRIPGTDIYRNVTRNETAEEIAGIKVFKFEGNIYFGSVENFRRSLYSKTKLNPKKILELQKKEKHKADAKFSDKVSLQPTIGPEVDKIDLDMSTVCKEMEKIRRDDEVLEQHYKSNIYENPTEMRRRCSVMQMDDNDPKKKKLAPSTTAIRVIVMDMSACAFMDSVGVRMLNQIHQDYRKIGVQLYMAHVVRTVRKILHQSGFYTNNESGHAFVTVHDAVLAALETIMGDCIQSELHETAVPSVQITHAESESIVPESSSPFAAITLGSEPPNTSELENLRETVQQLSHHNRLLRRLLNKREFSNAEAVSTDESDAEDQESTPRRRRGWSNLKKMVNISHRFKTGSSNDTEMGADASRRESVKPQNNTVAVVPFNSFDGVTNTAFENLPPEQQITSV